jgi:hypothetical protein
MPPKKGQAKKKRVPHANETPLKALQPGHGAVERAKNQMWSEPSSSAQQTTSTRSNVPVAKPKYKASSTATIGIGIGRGGGGIKKKKVAAAATTVVNTTTSSDVGSSVGTTGRANPDTDFFGGRPS